VWHRIPHVLPLFAALGGLLLLATACAPSPTVKSPTATPQPTATIATATATVAPTATAAHYPVKVYFSRHPDSDNTPTAVFAVTRVSPTLGVATFAIQQLIAGPSATERNAGYYTELTTAISGASNCGADFTVTLDHRGAKAEAGTVTLQFCRTVSLAGDLSGTRITAQITRTLTQFPNNQRVVILTSDGNCFDDLSGRNLCLN
jgi:spore germination protein GerM